MLFKSEIISKAVLTVNNRIKELDKDKVASLQKNATIEPDEVFAYQSAQSRAFTEQKISKIDAQWLYNMLSGFNSKPLADRIVALEFIVVIVKGQRGL